MEASYYNIQSANRSFLVLRTQNIEPELAGIVRSRLFSPKAHPAAWKAILMAATEYVAAKDWARGALSDDEWRRATVYLDETLDHIVQYCVAENSKGLQATQNYIHDIGDRSARRGGKFEQDIIRGFAADPRTRAGRRDIQDAILTHRDHHAHHQQLSALSSGDAVPNDMLFSQLLDIVLAMRQGRSYRRTSPPADSSTPDPNAAQFGAALSWADITAHIVEKCYETCTAQSEYPAASDAVRKALSLFEMQRGFFTALDTDLHFRGGRA